MSKSLRPVFLIILLFVFVESFGQGQPKFPKVIPEFGPTYKIENPSFSTNISEHYKVVFDISKPAQDPSVINPNFEGVARFLNMHTQAGKPMATMEVAVVIHGEAAFALLQNSFYKEIYEVNNPNIPLIEALHKNGVTLILCGQTGEHRNITPQRRVPNIDVSLSAMTALIQLQNDDYRLISF